MKKEIIEILEKKIYFEKYIKNKYTLLYNKIIEFNLNKNISWLNKLYDFIYNIKENPICKNCGKELKFKNKISIGYGIYCSNKCTSQATRLIVKQTNLEKFGVEYPLQNEEIKNKIKENNLKKYGVTSTLSDNNVQEKIKQTNLEKYGTENPFGSDKIKEKIKQTNLEKYGVEYSSQNDEIKEKTKQTNLEKYGVKTSLCLDENRKKMILKNLEIFGVEYPLQNEIIKNKSNKTILKKYGVDNISKSEHYKTKIENNIVEIWSKKLNTNNLKYRNGVFYIEKYCKNHMMFNIKYDDLYNRIHLGCENICTKCNPISKQSKIKENEVKELIKSLNVFYIKNNRKLLKGKEIDIYLPDHKIGIEFDGLYWHSNKFFLRDYHLNKTEECEKQGIQLLHIFEDEWIHKKEIVKSIIKSKLGIIENKIFARKCEIKEIDDNKLIRDFLETNHLQGFVGSKVKIGLFYNDELLSLMTFGKKRIALGNKSQNIDNEYEMLRFCNKLNIQVIGGASKLLKYFIKKYQPKSILTFADRRYSNGNLYKELGFNHIENTEPNYWYFKKNELIRYHRFSFRKDKLIKEGYDFNKTEKEIMKEIGYYYIYDSGNMRFKMNINQF